MMVTYRRSFLIGLAGFTLSGIASNLATLLIFASGLLGFVLKLVPEEQPLVRLWLGVILAFVGLGLGGAAGGLVRGYTLQRVDTQASRKRYLAGGAFASGIAYGVLVIPALLFISLVSIYNVGASTDPASFVVLFTLVGALFGLVNGLVLALLTVRLRYIWLPWLANILGSAAGGALIGLLIWQPEWIAASSSKLVAIGLFLVVSGLVINAIAGGMLGLAYAWLARERRSFGDAAVAPRGWQDIATIAIGSLVLLVVMATTNHIANFITIYPGTISTSLESPTEGVHWLAAESVAALEGSLPQEASGPALAVARSGSAQLAWADGGPTGEVYYADRPVGTEATWSEAVNVSNSPQVASQQPQIAAGADGAAYIAWAEDGAIRFSSCREGACTPPVTVSAAGPGCPADAPASWPALAVAHSGSVQLAWSAGQEAVALASWAEGEAPGSGDVVCLSTPGLAGPRARLSASGETVYMVASAPPASDAAPIYQAEFQSGAWSAPRSTGQGSAAEILAAVDGSARLVWCDANGALVYQAGDGAPETFDVPGCLARPALVEDSTAQIHLLYAAAGLDNNFGEPQRFFSLAEQIRQESGWTAPAIAALPAMATGLSAAPSPDGELNLAYFDAPGGAPAVTYAQQPLYACNTDGLVPAARAMLDVIESGEFHPEDYRSPFCGNRYEGIVHMPRPLLQTTDLPEGEPTGFDQLASLLTEARYEVLFSNMQWDADQDGLSPGFRQIESAAWLYQNLKAHPELYPRGLTVRILLGNYPNLATLEYGDQIWGVIDDLANAGIDTMEDPAIGWKLEVANYAGSFPHSHTKFVVLDGRSLLSAGFNISWYHLPKSDPSNKGDDLVDLGLAVSGPVAQTSIMIFDDMWEGANQLVCPDLQAEDLEKSCTWETAAVSHTPEVLRYDLQDSPGTAFAIYRTGDYKEADQAYVAAIRSAQSTIDAMQVNFSADMICMVNLVMPEVCDYSNALPYMEALVDTAEQNGTRIRVIVENANSNGLENRVGIQILEDELARRGIQDLVEVRFFDGRLHAKSTLIDEQLLIIGSQNFHYSSFSEGGLLEFNGVTTSPGAIETYQQMFDLYWQQAIPSAEAVWGTAGE